MFLKLVLLLNNQWDLQKQIKEQVYIQRRKRLKNNTLSQWRKAIDY